MKNDKLERRCTQGGVSLRETTSEDGKSKSCTIRGYAIVFNEKSVLMDEWGEVFREIIDPSCVTEEYLRECDIKMTLFHNREKLLARWNKGEGSLRLFVDEVGVGFEFGADLETELGRYCASSVKRGDMNGCSFTFIPDMDSSEFSEDKEDRCLLVRHKRFRWLGEMTIGSDPAYPATTVNAREVLSNTPERLAEAKRRLAEASSKAVTMRARLNRMA